MIMLADEVPDMGIRSASPSAGTPVAVMVYVEDVDSVFGRALAAGAKELRRWRTSSTATGPVLRGPVGPPLDVASHVEDVPEDEMMRRAAEMGAPPAVLEAVARPGVGDLVAGVAQAAHGDARHQRLAPDAVALQPHQ